MLSIYLTFALVGVFLIPPMLFRRKRKNGGAVRTFFSAHLVKILAQVTSGQVTRSGQVTQPPKKL